jgi:hypothetical protein
MKKWSLKRRVPVEKPLFQQPVKKAVVLKRVPVSPRHVRTECAKSGGEEKADGFLHPSG